ncbi:MAG: hypothetical protein NVSMB51_13550 [Solirubrobacteraceae bacterium]
MSARVARDQGFTMIELLVAIFVLVVGITAMIGVLDSGRKLTLVSERQTTMVHRAQRELERIESIGYPKAAMVAVPATSTDPSNPDYFVAQGPPATFQYDRRSSASEAIAVDATNGTVPATATPWSDGKLSGYVYDFITWTSDPNCAGGAICPATQDYRRVTVEVTLTGAAHPSSPAIVSSVIADPNATPNGAPANSAQNPLQSPTTQCTNGVGAIVPCTNGLGGGTPVTYFPCDTQAMSFSGSLLGGYNNACTPPSTNHATQCTIALCNVLQCTPTNVLTPLVSGCQNPDLMSTTPPSGMPATPYCFSTDVGCPSGSSPSGGGGKVIRKDSSDCTAANPWSQSDNTKGVFWVTPALGTATTLTGAGGTTLYTQTTSGVAASVTICVGIYLVPNLLDLISTPPVKLGVAAYTSAAWPGVPTPVSFGFNYLAAATTQLVAAGTRIGVRVWVAASSSSDVTLIYDNAQFASQIQLNTQ